MGAFANEDVDSKIFHGLVQALLHSSIESVNLIYEQDVAWLEIRKYGRQIRFAIQNWTGC
jgi:hypothetical protein